MLWKGLQKPHLAEIGSLFCLSSLRKVFCRSSNPTERASPMLNAPTIDALPTGRVVITGGTGFIGLSLARHLDALGYEVVLISRHAPKAEGPWAHSEWDGRTVGKWARHLEGARAVVNLAGRTVDCIKSAAHCDEILHSRVDSTLAVGEALRSIEGRPPVWVQMSTAHIYGDPPEAWCDEDSALGNGLAPEVGEAWEKACRQGACSGVRQVVLRTGFVLGMTGGAFPKMRRLARLGLGGRVGSGTQGISWIHINDLNALITHAIVNTAIRGVYVATAPHPVSQEEFMRELRRAIGMPLGLPVAEWVIRFGAYWFLRTDPELVLLGRYCTSRRLKDEGYSFLFPKLGDAMENLCR